ncbi:cobalt ABC transporter permease [Brochothrix campestris FSL F6-1037]|uniref:Energy-coupling factor transporter transmembrane protein EcfT n=2 Tax=Brochothrix campestris TaxID=2757 RepID=W7CVW5_9LIST|nr:cobalt ABC transporter permease [Brochothrix campestris FSL F6-1037]
MNNMILGRFVPGDSWLHQLDARAKLVAVMYFIVMVFFANNLLSYLLSFLLVFSLLVLSKIPFLFFIRGLRPIIFLILLTVILQLFFTTEGQVLLQFGPLQITDAGIINAVFIALRFMLIIFMTTLLSLTTSPISLTDGIESLLNPLRKVKFPVHEMALMLSIALRFIPTLMDEAEKIMQAQKSRGVEFNSGSLLARVKAIIPLLIPLFISAFKRAEDLAIAMEARGYHGGEGRTKYRILKWEARDTLMIVLMMVYTLLLFLTRGG